MINTGWLHIVCSCDIRAYMKDGYSEMVVGNAVSNLVCTRAQWNWRVPF